MAWRVESGLEGGVGQRACFGQGETGELLVCEVGAGKIKRVADAALFGDRFEPR